MANIQNTSSSTTSGSKATGQFTRTFSAIVPYNRQLTEEDEAALIILQLYRGDALLGTIVDPEETRTKTRFELPILIDNDTEEEERPTSIEGTFKQPDEPSNGTSKFQTRKKRNTTGAPNHCSNCFGTDHVRSNCTTLPCKFAVKQIMSTKTVRWGWLDAGSNRMNGIARNGYVMS